MSKDREVIFTPTAKQSEFLSSNADILLFAGGA
jgi:hypothetical protein